MLKDRQKSEFDGFLDLGNAIGAADHHAPTDPIAQANN